MNIDFPFHFDSRGRTAATDDDDHIRDMIYLVLFTAPGQEKLIGGFMNVTFAADDVEATAKELKARGVEFVQEPKTESWGTSAIFKDSEGNQFVLGTK